MVTSPPNNLDIAYGTHNDALSCPRYLRFRRRWLARWLSWLTEDGRLCLKIPLDKNKDGQQSVGADLTTVAKEIGFRYHSTIVWNEGNISRRTAFMDWTNGLWSFNGESRRRTGHPAPFPVELPRRCIKLFSFVGDTLLDPFMCGGTTLARARLEKARLEKKPPIDHHPVL